MKKLIACLLAIALFASIAVGCASNDTATDSGDTQTDTNTQTGTETDGGSEDQELTHLRVAVQPYYNGMQMAYILDKGLDKEYGLNLSPFSSPTAPPPTKPWRPMSGT